MKREELQERIKQLHSQKTEEQLIKEDADILMANYLSEIDRMGIKKKDLAAQIKTSASYLTQVFRGDKPLNFITLAKIQKALKIRFQVYAIPTDAFTFKHEPSFNYEDASGFNYPDGYTILQMRGPKFQTLNDKENVA